MKLIIAKFGHFIMDFSFKHPFITALISVVLWGACYLAWSAVYERPVLGIVMCIVNIIMALISMICAMNISIVINMKNGMFHEGVFSDDFDPKKW